MQHIERTFLEIAKRYISTLLKNKKDTLNALIHHFSFSLTGVFITLFIQQSVSLLETNNSEGFYDLMLYGGIFFTLFQLYLLSISSLGWCRFYPYVKQSIYEDYLPKFVKLDNTAYESVGTGQATAIISKGAQMFTLLGDGLMITGSKAIVGLVFVFFMVSQVSIIFSGIFVILLIIGLWLGVFLNSKVLLYRRMRVEYDNRLTSKIVKIIMSKYEILQTNKINKEVNQLMSFADKKAYYNKKMAVPLILFFLVPDVIVIGLLLGVFIFFGNMYFAGEIELGLLVGISGSLILMQAVFHEVMVLFKDFTKNFGEVEKLWDFFDSTPDIKGYNSGAKFEYKKGHIEVKNLDFGYNDKQKVFEKFDLEIKGGKITALVGNSGSGKTTLVKLISGYIRQDSGKIKVDGQNLEKISLKSYYKNIGYLTQEPSVFDGTIRDNLTYAVERDLKEGELAEVIKLAKCEFIYELENSIDTEIGEKGIRLSGGQRQRLAIAKIFLKDPKIIILDEPTSALDSFSEEQITKAMHNLFKGRTVIIIAHRLQTVKNADKILVLENGKVVEQGKHDELVKEKGIYKKMLDLQSGF